MFFHSDNDPHMTKAEGAAELGVSPRTFDKLLPTIPHFRIGRKILIRRSELRRWLAQYRVSPNDSDLQRIVVGMKKHVCDFLGLLLPITLAFRATEINIKQVDK